jgi:GT2 family glycosyltransferase
MGCGPAGSPLRPPRAAPAHPRSSVALTPSRARATAAPVPDVWLVVVNWNCAALLPACLSALERLTVPAHVVVVDNGSTDGSEAMVARHPGVVWLPLGENRGFAEANNVALRHALAAGARYVALVNPDTVVDPGWLEALLADAELHPEAGLWNGLLLFSADPGRVNSTGIVFDRFLRAFDRDFGVPLAQLRRDAGPVPAVTGGATLLRSEMLRAVGLFDPAYFAYYEDVDLSLRAARAGFGCRYAPGARALHGFGTSLGATSPRRAYYLARNHLRSVATYLPFPLALTVAPAFALARVALKAPAELACGRPAHALAHLRGARDGAIAAAGVLARRLGGGVPHP